jgi:hypothetical protein
MIAHSDPHRDGRLDDLERAILLLENTPLGDVACAIPFPRAAIAESEGETHSRQGMMRQRKPRPSIPAT